MNPLPSKLAAATVAAALVAAACAGTPGDGPGDALVCHSSDVPGRFFRQTEGEFTARDLADRGTDPDQREAELREAGMVAGYLSYWAESVDRPPFDPPAEILCQVIIFEDAQQADDFLEALDVSPEAFSATVMGLLPGEVRLVDELPADSAGSLSPARIFRVTAEDGLVRVTLFAVISASGRYVQSVTMGDPEGRTTLDEVLAIHESVAARAR